MAGEKVFMWIIGIAVLLLVANQMGYLDLGASTTTTTSQSGQTVPLQCSVAPTVQLAANDKYSSGQTNWGNWKYKLNGGGTQTDADGSFEVGIDATLSVLVADTNSSLYYRNLWNPEIVRCGINPDAYNEVVRFTTYETICYDETGSAINGSRYAENLSISTGGSRNVKCELTGVAKRGVPQGGVMVLEFNQSIYEEGEMAVTWDGATLSPTATPSAYTVALAGATTKAYKVPAFEGAGTHTFFINIVAESDEDPLTPEVSSIDAYSDGVIGRIFPVNCYEEEDVSPSEFKCGIEDMDSTFTSPGGTSKEDAQITTFLITVI